MTWLNSNMTKHVYACYLCSISYKTEASPWLWNNSRHYGNTSDPGFNNNNKKLLFYSTITAFKQCKDSILFSNPQRTASIMGSVPELQSEPPDSCHNLSQAYLGNRMSTAMSQKSIDNIIMIGMMRIRKMKTRVCQTGKLQCTLPEVSLKQHVSCYIIQIFATWAISGHEPMLYILFRQH